MTEKLKYSKGSRKEKKSVFEKGSKFGRNFNIVVGSVALAGAFIAPPILGAGLTLYAEVNYVQAGGFEVARRFSKKRSKKSKDSK